MSLLRRNDTVKVMTGKDRGKTGKILRVEPAQERAIIEGINVVKRHLRQTKQDQAGGIVDRPAPVRLCNVQLVCPRCNRPTRLGVTRPDGERKVRRCKRCNEPVD